MEKKHYKLKKAFKKIKMSNRKIKRIKFTVDLLFSDSIDKKEIPEISRKIADALRHEVDSGNGFAPETDDSPYTNEIRVMNDEAGVVILSFGNQGWVEKIIPIQ